MKRLLSEEQFETDIVNDLIHKNEFIQSSSEDYDKEYNLDKKILFQFLRNTQTKEIEELEKKHTHDIENYLVKKIRNEIKKYGLLYLLRHGFTDRGIDIKLFYPKPSTSINKIANENYNKNIFSVIRQLKYFDNIKKHNANSVDLVLFINGIPVITAELKNQYTGQNVVDAIEQYKKDRKPTDTLFEFNKGSLVHFALDTNSVSMTTKLEGEKTIFLPFNQGFNEGKGNPPNQEDDYATSYLWNRIWTKDCLSTLIQRFLLVIEDKSVRKHDKLIFPRYHQLDCVFNLLNHIQDNGIGFRYLNQHSAGSGKTNTIAWFAHSLSNLHIDDKAVFDHIFIVTNRVNLDKQLQDNIHQFEHKQGVVYAVQDGSSDLLKALNSGARIIITTIQKFKYILDKVSSLSNKKSAVIIDEAHNSQGGKYADNLKTLLADDQFEVTAEDNINAIIKEYKEIKNVSYFAFTATPKPETIEIFSLGHAEKKPFHVYSMKQAIEEGYIINVLKNYMTYDAFYELAKKVQDNPTLLRNKAAKQIAMFAKLHPENISQKVRIIMEHFQHNIQNALDGNAKAMIVTESRLAALRYKQAIDEYNEQHKYEGIKSLVAFSGEIIQDGIRFTEENINKIKESELPNVFNNAEYKLLIVADKYQTGFDQPKLSAMYVDKKLQGINAVQTLSRLNRIYHNKQTFIIDFVNKVEDIMFAFSNYYKVTDLQRETDVNKIYDYRKLLRDFQIYDDSDIVNIYNDYIIFKNDNNKLKVKSINKNIDKTISKFETLSDFDKLEFISFAERYIALYDLILQLALQPDLDVYKEYVLLSFLLKKVNVNNNLADSVVETYRSLEDLVDLEHLIIKENGTHQIDLDKLQVIKLPDFETVRGIVEKKQDKIPLEELIKAFNEQFGLEYSASNPLKSIINSFLSNDDWREIAQANDLDNFKILMNKQFKNDVFKLHKNNEELFKKLMTNKDMQEIIQNMIIQEFYTSI